MQNHSQDPRWMSDGPHLRETRQHDSDDVDAVGQLVTRLEYHHIGDVGELANIRHTHSRLEDTPLHLRLQLNATLPIFRLPTETLLEILEIIALSDPPRPPPKRDPITDKLYPGHLPTELGWIRLTHVCHRIRDILLGSPRIWARTICFLPKAHEELVRRAQSAPLSIIADRRRHDIPSRLFESLWDHAREINVHEFESRWFAESSRFPPHGLPMLEKFTLDAQIMTESMEVQASPSLPSPRLRELRLKNVFIHMTGCVGLTHLELSQSYFSPIPLRPFLDILSSSPSLETVILTRCLPLSEEWASSESAAVIHLPRLQELRVSGPCPWCISLWTHLVVSPSVSLHFDIDCPSEPDLFRQRTVLLAQINTDRRGFVRTLGDHFRALVESDHPIVGMSVRDSFDGLQDLSIHLYVAGAGADAASEYRTAFPEDYGVALELKFYRWRPSALDILEVVQLITSNFELHRLKTLDIRLEKPSLLGDVDSLRWRDALGPLSSVTALNIGPVLGNPLLGALGALSTSTDSSSSHVGDHALLFPGLHTLCFAGSMVPYNGEDAQLRLAWSEILDVLRERSRRGVGVKSVWIDSCAHSRTVELVRRLPEIVPDVRIHPQNEEVIFLGAVEGQISL